jgi:hypothetical protein
MPMTMAKTTDISREKVKRVDHRKSEHGSADDQEQLYRYRTVK